MIEQLDSVIVDFHKTLLPLIFNLMDDPIEEIQKQATNALDILLEGMGSDIKQYLVPLMEKLVFLIDRGNEELRKTVLATIGSAAHASGKVKKKKDGNH